MGESHCLVVTAFVQDDEKVLGIDSGYGYTTLRMYSLSLNCTLMNG